MAHEDLFQVKQVRILFRCGCETLISLPFPSTPTRQFTFRTNIAKVSGNRQSPVNSSGPNWFL
jgi:hypothetical protein